MKNHLKCKTEVQDLCQTTRGVYKLAIVDVSEVAIMGVYKVLFSIKKGRQVLDQEWCAFKIFYLKTFGTVFFAFWRNLMFPLRAE